MREVTFRQLKRRSYENPERFGMRPEKGWKWVQRICFRLLSAIGAYCIDETIEEVLCRPDTLMMRIFEQRAYIEEEFTRMPDVMLMGPEEYREVMDEMLQPLAGLCSFDARYMHDGCIAGLRVHIIPWMHGILCLPGAILEERAVAHG